MVLSQVSTIRESSDDSVYTLEGRELTKEEVLKQANQEATILLVTLLAIAGIYFGLWFWARKNPLPALIVALVFYLTLVTLDFILAGILRGILIKVVIILVLANGVKSALAYRKLQRQAG